MYSQIFLCTGSEPSIYCQILEGKNVFIAKKNVAASSVSIRLLC